MDTSMDSNEKGAGHEISQPLEFPCAASMAAPVILRKGKRQDLTPQSPSGQAHKPYQDVWHVLADSLGAYGRPGRFKK